MKDSPEGNPILRGLPDRAKGVYFKIRESAWIAYLAAFAGLSLYFWQAQTYAHTLTSFLDEAGYLYSGDLFTKGVLRPFQDNGIIRLYPPLAYLIPGKVESWFGAGLRTGRYFSIFCALVMIVALWLTARRLSGKWWAAAVVWAIALTPISIQVYSVAITEALVACLLTICLLFVLGEGRRLWQIITGSVLAGLVVMTRQNLAPLVPLLVAYVFWQHRKRAGWWALAGCLLPIVIFHAIYWPNILEIWAVWLPARLTPFLDPYRIISANTPGVTGIGFISRLSAFLQAIRFHYFTTIGFCVCLFLWPKWKNWNNPTNRRMAFFLAALFLTLALIHAWASFLSPAPAVSCTYCFTPYLSFFDITVLLLVIISIPSWKKGTSRFPQVVILVFTLLLSMGIGYAAFDTLGPWVLDLKFPAFNRGLDPRLWSPFISLWDILANKFQQDYWTVRAPVAAIAGFLVGSLTILFGRLVYNRMTRSKKVIGVSFGAFLLPLVLSAGILVSPLLVGSYRDKGLCTADTLKVYEEIGHTLQETIPENSQVYWGARNAVPLLYAPTLHIYNPQIYALSYFHAGGDSSKLLKHGFWNLELAKRWQSEVSFMVVGSNWNESPDFPGEHFLSNYTVSRTISSNPCDPSSFYLIYQKKP